MLVLALLVACGGGKQVEAQTVLPGARPVAVSVKEVGVAGRF